MKLVELVIERLPGIDAPLVLDALGAGVNVVLGPNASGKSSLVRALTALLYPRPQPAQPLSLSAVFEMRGQRWSVQRTGAVVRWERDGERAEPPPLPEPRFWPCYAISVEDLLVGAPGASEALFAERLRRELAGGYDLRAALAGAVERPSGRTQARALHAAQRVLDRERQRHAALRREERALDALRERHAQAAQAREAAARCAHALAVLEARARAADVARRLAALPADLHRLAGDEVERLDELRARADGLAARLAEHGEAERAARAALGSLPGAGGEPLPDAAARADARALIERLRAAQARAAPLRVALAEARALRQQAGEALGLAAQARPKRVSGHDVAQAEAEVARLWDLEREVAVLAAREALLPVPDGGSATPASEHEQLRLLNEWLEAPVAPRWDFWRMAATVVLGLGLIALAVQGALPGQPWLLLLALVPAAAAAWLLYAPDPGTRVRRAAGRRVAALAAAHPRGPAGAGREPGVIALPLTRERVCAARDALACRLRERESAQRDMRLRELLAAERRGAQQALAGAAATLGGHAAALGAVLDATPDTTLGAAPDTAVTEAPRRATPGAALARWLRLVHEHDAAVAKEATLAAQHADARAAASACHRRACEMLARFEQAGPVPAPDADAVDLDARLRAFEQRLAERERQQGIVARARAATAADSAEAERVAAQRSALFARAGIADGDRAATLRRVRSLPGWRDAQAERLAAAEALRQAEAACAGDARIGALLAGGDGASLRGLRERLLAQAAKHDELLAAIAAVEARLGQARAARALEDARGARAQALESLRAVHRQRLRAAAASLLARDVEREHVADAGAAGLGEASRLFATMTRHRWRLEFSPAAGSPFGARDSASGTLRALDELSTATRAQLLLALRLAFLARAERGRVPLPVVLDEALATADPRRYAAVAGALAAISGGPGGEAQPEAARQILYLSAQPEDAARWQAITGPAPVVHRLRESSTPAPGRHAPAPEPLPPVPAPARMDAAAYARCLGVPAPRPWAAPGELHLFHLLGDDLSLLYRLLHECGVERAGELRLLLEQGRAEILLEPGQCRALAARLAVHDAWQGAWRQGRGRPLDDAALAASGVLNETWLEDVAVLARRLDGDARRLLDALEAGEIKGFRTRTREALESWCLRAAHLDRREPLAAAALTFQVLAEARTWLDQGAITARQVRALLRALDPPRAAAAA